MRVEAGTDAALIARMLELIPARVGSTTVHEGPQPPAHHAPAGEVHAAALAADQTPHENVLPPTPMPAAGAASTPVIVWLPVPQPAPSHRPIDADGDGGTPAKRRPPEAGEAAFVLHVPSAGAVEIRLTLGGGGVRAAVTTPAGEIGERALVARDDLIARLTRATGRPAVADVRIRPQPHVDLRA